MGLGDTLVKIEMLVEMTRKDKTHKLVNVAMQATHSIHNIINMLC